MKHYMRYYVWFYVLLIPVLGFGFLLAPAYIAFKILASAERLIRIWARPY